MKKINWGIIGLGNIAQNFSEGFFYTNNSKLLAISSHLVIKTLPDHIYKPWQTKKNLKIIWNELNFKSIANLLS